jgi:hypothetical protein
MPLRAGAKKLELPYGSVAERRLVTVEPPELVVVVHVLANTQ